MGITSSSYDDNLAPIHGQFSCLALFKTVQPNSPGDPTWVADTRSERSNVHSLSFWRISTKLHFDWLFLAISPINYQPFYFFEGKKENSQASC